VSARNPVHNDPQVRTRGEGYYGVRLTRFVSCGDPGGYRALEFVYLFPTREERDAYARDLRRKHSSRRRDAPIIEAFAAPAVEPSWLYMVIEEYPPFTIDVFSKIARDQRRQRARKKQFRRLLQKAAELAAEGRS